MPSINMLNVWCNLDYVKNESKLAVRMILPYWFDHLEEIFSYKEVQLPSAENVNETPG